MHGLLRLRYVAPLALLLLSACDTAPSSQAPAADPTAPRSNGQVGAQDGLPAQAKQTKAEIGATPKE